MASGSSAFRRWRRHHRQSERSAVDLEQTSPELDPCWITPSNMSKLSTLLTGVPVSKTPHKTLKMAYCRILEMLQDLPKDYIYRVHTEKLMHEKIDMVEKTPDVAELEKKLSGIQVEEAIMHARQEIRLIRNMRVYKPWEKLIAEPPAHQWTWPPHK